MKELFGPRTKIGQDRKSCSKYVGYKKKNEAELEDRIHVLINCERLFLNLYLCHFFLWIFQLRKDVLGSSLKNSIQYAIFM